MMGNIENPLVSIIIPIYNGELYLDDCMNTVLNQTYKNIEVILVDDGSTDSSLRLCQEYAMKDQRIKVLHQENAGQAVARNNAFAVAEGEYISYVDCDDYMSENYIELLMKEAVGKNADIVQCYAKKFWEDGKEEKVVVEEKVPCAYTASEVLKEFSYQRKFYAAPWAKVIRKNLMENLEFPANTGYEDMAVMYKLFGKSSGVIVLPEIMYFYRQHHASTMHMNFSEKKIDRIRIAEDFKAYIEEYFPENKLAVKTRYLLANLQLLMDLPFEKEYRDLRKEVKNNILSVRKAVIFDKNSKSSLRVMALASYLGIYNLMLLGRVYKKVFS